MNNKKQTSAKQAPVHVIRCGEIIASVFLAQSNAGYSYWYFALSRAWSSMNTGKESQGNSFFDNNQQDIILAASQASAWIRERRQPAVDAQAPTTRSEGQE